jgi:mannose-6-phosphate isomerase-like protein (cupin superfamily)
MPSTWFLDSLVTTLVRGEETDGRFAVLLFDMRAGQAAPLHVHSDSDECFFLLAGRMTLWSGDLTVDLSPGEFFRAPRALPHTYRVDDRADARALVTVSPAGFEEFVARAGVVAEELRLPDPRTQDRAALARLAMQFRIEILGPPGMLPTTMAAAQAAPVKESG